MDDEALRPRIGLGLGLLVGSLLVAMLWVGVGGARANAAATTETRAEPIAVVAPGDDGETGIDDGGFGATLGIVLGVSAVVAYGYMRMRNQ